jgi:hypothetical protein
MVSRLTVPLGVTSGHRKPDGHDLRLPLHLRWRGLLRLVRDALLEGCPRGRARAPDRHLRLAEFGIVEGAGATLDAAKLKEKRLPRGNFEARNSPYLRGSAHLDRMPYYLAQSPRATKLKCRAAS